MVYNSYISSTISYFLSSNSSITKILTLKNYIIISSNLTFYIKENSYKINSTFATNLNNY